MTTTNKKAVARSCNSGDRDDHPTNPQREEGTIMTSLSGLSTQAVADTSTCPSWCTSTGRFHDDDQAHDGPGWLVEGNSANDQGLGLVELGTGTNEHGSLVVTVDALSAELSIAKAQELVESLNKAIAWARETAATRTHIEGCYLPTDHRGSCLLRQPFRIRPEGGREIVGGSIA